MYKYYTVTPLKYVEGGPGLTLPEVVYNSYSVRMFGGDGRLRIFKCAVPSSFTTIKNSRILPGLMWGPWLRARHLSQFLQLTRLHV